MTNTILVKIITPSHLLLECEASIATMPGSEGVFGVLPKHAPLVASLKAGVVTIAANNKNFRYFIDDGIAQVTGEEVNIITEFAIDLATIQQAEIIAKIATFQESASQQDITAQKLAELQQNIARYESALAVIMSEHK